MSSINRGMLVAVSGFSGAGKGTIMKSLLKKYPQYALSVSATTRKPRVGEEEGREYFFKTDEEFQTMIVNEELLEYAGYVGHYYGTPKSYVEEMRNGGKDVILEIEVQGALKVKEKFPELILVFIAAPSVKEIKNRLIHRGTEDNDTIEERISQIERELKSACKYDYIVINDTVDESVERINHIVEAEKNKIDNKADFIKKLEQEIREA